MLERTYAAGVIALFFVSFAVTGHGLTLDQESEVNSFAPVRREKKGGIAKSSVLAPVRGHGGTRATFVESAEYYTYWNTSNTIDVYLNETHVYCGTWPNGQGTFALTRDGAFWVPAWNQWATIQRGGPGEDSIIQWSGTQAWVGRASSTAWTSSTWKIYDRASSAMPGKTICRKDAQTYTCVNADGGRATGTVGTGTNSNYVWMTWSASYQYARSTSTYGSLFWQLGALWVRIVPAATVVAENSYCSNRDTTKGAMVATNNAGACAAHVGATPGCGPTFEYAPATGWCDCVPSDAHPSACSVTGYNTYEVRSFNSRASEAAQRIAANPNGKLGKALTITLVWDNRNDLDLSITGTYTVDYGNKSSFDNVSRHNIDENSGATLKTNPVENIIFDAATSGTYNVYVNFYHRNDGPDTTPFTVIVQTVEGKGQVSVDGTVVPYNAPKDSKGQVCKSQGSCLQKVKVCTVTIA